jgi:hypothetical protein
MDESKKIILPNIEHYQRLLATEPDPKEREAIARLLAKQQAKLREREGKGAVPKAYFAIPANASDLYQCAP